MNKNIGVNESAEIDETYSCSNKVRCSRVCPDTIQKLPTSIFPLSIFSKL